MEMSFTDSRPLVPGDSSQGLRPLGWSELCARLVAVHDTRDILAGPLSGFGVGPDDGTSGPQASNGSSFHSSAAALLQALETETDAAVNLAFSANGNGVSGTEVAAPNAAKLRRPDENCHD